jgi:hypothetical protein
MNISFYKELTKYDSVYSGWKEGLEDCGAKNVIPITKAYEVLKKLDFVPDIQIIEDPSEHELDLLQEKKAVKTVCIVGDNYKTFYKNYPFVNLWVEPCFYDKSTEDSFNKDGLPFYYCPLASQESLIPFYTELERRYDVSADDPMKDPKLKSIVIKSDTAFSEMTYGNTKVNLNYQIPRKDFVYLNQKAFDIPMSGNFELSTIPQVIEIFEGKVGYTSQPEMRDKIIYYIEHEEERTRMAIKGYEVCIAKHTYTYRMRDLLKKLKVL